MLNQTGKIITKSSVITDRLSITMPELIIDYLFSSNQSDLYITGHHTSHKLNLNICRLIERWRNSVSSREKK